MKEPDRLYKKAIYWLAGLLVVAAAATGWAYDTQDSNQNGVRVTVTPRVLSPGKAAQFEIRLNTHSVALEQDLTQVAELRDSLGRVYQVKGWDGSPPGGHHRSGTLTFANLQESIDGITLVLRDIAGVPQRTFSWKIEQ